MSKLSRRKARENAFIALFSASFGADLPEVVETVRAEDPDYAVDTYGEGLLHSVQQNAEAIDAMIEGKLKGWKVQRLSKTSLAILRLAVAEICYGEEDIESVAINEAVELAKKYGDEGDYQFINGVLGSISRERAAHEKAPEPAQEPGEVT